MELRRGAGTNAERAEGTVDPLLEPFRLKGLLLRNRIMSTSHASELDEGGLPKERYQRYHEEKAKGGLALTMFGGSSMVSKDTSWGGGQLDFSSDEIIPYLQSLSARVHKHGAAIMCQISHLGRRGDPNTWNWLPTVAPSRIRERRHRSFPKEMDRADIVRVIRDYVSAALRAKEGGLDGIETYASGHLMGQFFSPLTNRRTDEFGGSLENRARFGLMVHEALRASLGSEWVVGLRMVIDEGESSIRFDDCVRIAELFEREGTIDFINCTFGRIDTDLALAENTLPGMSQPSAPFLNLVGAFKRNTSLPVFHAARITDLATARYAVSNGLLDMVGMTRAHIADPHIVMKLQRGEEDRIRPCVGASFCSYTKLSCIHNPATSREEKLPHVIEPAIGPLRKVLVIGGGPAGLEAARVCAERGHHVILFEAGAKLGGQVFLASRASWRREIWAVIEWRVAELERLGVQVRVNTSADANLVSDELPDVIIVATGGLPDTERVEASEKPLVGADLCVSTWDILSNSAAAARNVLLYDGTGRHPGPSVALHLAERGSTVHFVTQDDYVAREMEYQSRVIYRKRFALNAISVTTDHQLVAVERVGNSLSARLRHELTEHQYSVLTDQVVVEHGTVPADDLFHALRASSVNDGVTDLDALLSMKPQPFPRYDSGRFELHRVGDAVSSRGIHNAIYDSLRLCSVL